MLSRWIRTWDSVIFKPLLLLLAGSGATPNMLTIASLAVIAVSAVLVGLGHTVSGGLTLLAGGVLDALDGELARYTRRQSAFGAFLDSTCDHIGDFTLYLGMTWLLLDRGVVVGIPLLLAAQFGSLFGSQVRSRAGMVGIDVKDVGCFTRLERIVVLVIGLCANRVMTALWVLAVGVNLSALQRLIRVIRVAAGSGERQP